MQGFLNSIIRGNDWVLLPLLPIVASQDLDFTFLATKGCKVRNLNDNSPVKLYSVQIHVTIYFNIPIKVFK
jgi:hypothetical protein